jgi:hypothetical protein
MNPSPTDDLELEGLLCTTLDEWSFLPGQTHTEDCGFWGTDDGDGEDYCDCPHRKDIDAWKKCLRELKAALTAREARKVAEAKIQELERVHCCDCEAESGNDDTALNVCSGQHVVRLEELRNQLAQLQQQTKKKGE